ncbi:MAG: F0F1 ATP synthase subunit delta [Candidatus Saccharimonadales bacterium]
MSRVTRKELVEVIGEQTLQVSGNTKQLVDNIAAYLATGHRSIDLGSLTRDIMQYRLERGYVEAVAVAAHPLSPTVMTDIEELLKEHFPGSKSIKVDQRIDESLVGGIRIELPRENLDLSIKTKLNLFKQLVADGN